MTVNKTIRESRFRSSRASLRLHPDLRAALDFLATSHSRTVSQLLEMVALDYARWALTAQFSDKGELLRREPFRFKSGREPKPFR
mgnify:CR=1 FL=1